MKVVSDKNMLFARTETMMHEIKVAPDSDEVLKVWIKEPTWLQVEQAMGSVMDMSEDGMNMDLNKMYRFMVDEFIEKTEPSLSALELMRLSPFVGAQLKEVLPNPFADLEKADTGNISKFKNQDKFNEKVDELNQETIELIEEIDKWQT